MLAASALTTLRGYDFPGNIRELENILERAFTLCEDSAIQAEDLLLPGGEPVSNHLAAPRSVAETIPVAAALALGDGEPKPGSGPVVNDLEGYLEGLEKAAILRALEATRHNKTAAARKLGITFKALRCRLKKLGLE